MKTTLTKIVCLLLLVLTGNASLAQCTIDSTQTAAGIYPDTLPDATAGQNYSQDITFIMLTDTLGLSINNYLLSSVVGLPVGLTWQCNNNLNGCNYDPSVSIYGCVNISGTPLVPGVYTMTVNVIADVQLVGQQTISFTRPLIVLPASVTNPGFSMINSSGCAPLSVDFISNNPAQAAYLWDFGNGNMSVLETPPTQVYSTPGTYIVTQTVTPNVIPSYYLTDITVSAIPNNYGGFIDDPDMYFLLFDSAGAQVYDSRPSVDNTFPPVSWPVPNIPLNSGNYSVHVWDEDGGLFGGDDDLGSISFQGNGSSGTATGTVGGASGLLIVNYTIFQTPVVPLVATDTIHVFSTPSVPLLSFSGPLSFCEGDSVTMSVNDSLNAVQWYESGTILPSDTGGSFTPIVSGSYNAVVTTLEGCSASSSSAQVNIFPTPAKPNFFINGSVFTTTAIGLNLQWYLNGVPIIGATGSTLAATQSGVYRLCGTDVNGCSNCSDTLVFTVSGVEEVQANQPDVYPNPCNGFFTINFGRDYSPGRTIRLADARGRILETIPHLTTSSYRYSEKLSAGVYLLEIEEGGNTFKTRLVVY